ncbi:MAG TPA: hypothetical protein PLP07_04215, partial [Pyrinomonadaceae bacterium]|nr:hypothetical protein [Pyrinomonadaceae bacterium]
TRVFVAFSGIVLFHNTILRIRVFSKIKAIAEELAVWTRKTIISQMLCIIQHIIYDTKIKMSDISHREQLD